MWYRTAQLTMDPAGQMRMDMPKTRFNIEDNLRHTVWTNTYENDPTIPVVIRLYSNNQEIGDIQFTYYPAYYDLSEGKLPYPIVNIFRVKIDELGLEEYMEINDLAGEDVESQRSGWGLGQYLYQLAKDYIAKHFPDAKFITGEVHSNTALKSRNKIFGKPHTLQKKKKEDRFKWKKEKITEPQAMKKLPPARWDSWGSAQIDNDKFVRVVHKLPEQKEPEPKPEDKSQLKMDL
jgi:hypothetical protein